MFITKLEFIKKENRLELWGSKYTFKSWVVTGSPILDLRTNTKYYSGDICFALLSYIDNTGKCHIVNEDQYFIPCK